MSDSTDLSEQTAEKDSSDAVPQRRYGYVAAKDKEALIARMKRIEGQARGIEKMISDDRYCIDILTQIAAVIAALETVASILLEDHVKHCVRHALASGDEAIAAEKTAELLEAVHRFTRTR
jgi:DNA-binding FrmR family transcriptional regulator